MNITTEIFIITHLNRLRVCFVEKIQQSTAEIMGVNVGISQLVGDCVQEQVSAFVIQVNCQVLQNIHVSVVDDVRHRRILALCAENKLLAVLIDKNLLINSPNLIDCLRADVEYQSIHQRNIVT